MNGTELFTLVARLSCDKTDFARALSDARNQAQSFDADIDATISATDNYSGTLSDAEDSAKTAELDAKGTLKATDSYSGALETAEGSAENASLDADGDIKVGEDTYSTDLQADVDSAGDAKLDADGDITVGTDSYSTDLETAEGKATTAKLNASGEVTAEIQPYSDALDQAEGKATEWEANFKETIGRAATALTAAGIVGTIKAIASGFQQMISNTANYADTVDKGSQALYLSKEAYQEWDHALGQSGASITDLTRGMKNLNGILFDGQEISEDMQKAFNAIGIDPRTYEDTQTLFEDVMDAIADIEDVGERGSILTKIFGPGGSNLLPLFEGGKEGLHGLLDEAHELGLIMSDEDIASGVAYGDAVANMNAAVDALKQNIVTGLFPLLTDAANAIAGIIATFNGRTNLKAYNEIEGVWEDLGESLEDVDSEVGGAKGLARKLWDLSTPAGKVAGDFDLWQKTAKKLIDDVPELSKYINLQTGEITASREELDGLIDSWGNYRKVQLINAAVGDMDEKVTEVFSRLLDAQVDVGVKEGELDVARDKAVASAEAIMDALGFSDDLKAEYDLSNPEHLHNLLSLAETEYLSGSGKLTSDEFLGFKDTIEDFDDADTALTKAQQKVEDLTDEYNAAKEAADKYREAADKLIEKLEDIPSDVHVAIHMDTDITGGRLRPGFTLMEHAKGLNYVPYDGYVAELHRGEVVLNQGQSRDFLDGGIDTSAIAAAIANAVRDGMSGMGINMDGQSVGNIVAETVSRNIASQLRGSRYV